MAKRAAARPSGSFFPPRLRPIVMARRHRPENKGSRHGAYPLSPSARFLLPEGADRLYETGTPSKARWSTWRSGRARPLPRSLAGRARFRLLHDDARHQTVPETSIIIEYLERTIPAGSRLFRSMPRRPSKRVSGIVSSTSMSRWPMQKIVTDKLRALARMTGAASSMRARRCLSPMTCSNGKWPTGLSQSAESSRSPTAPPPPPSSMPASSCLSTARHPISPPISSDCSSALFSAHARRGATLTSRVSLPRRDSRTLPLTRAISCRHH